MQVILHLNDMHEMSDRVVGTMITNLIAGNTNHSQLFAAESIWNYYFLIRLNSKHCISTASQSI